jgi:hypothetical protein
MSSPWRRICGSVTPNWSIRLVRISSARRTASSLSAAVRLCPEALCSCSRSAHSSPEVEPQLDRPIPEVFQPQQVLAVVGLHGREHFLPPREPPEYIAYGPVLGQRPLLELVRRPDRVDQELILLRKRRIDAQPLELAQTFGRLALRIGSDLGP